MKSLSFSHFLLAFGCIFCFTAIGVPQTKNVVIPKPTSFITAPKAFVAKLRTSENEIYSIKGWATFTITSAKLDDTLLGTVHYAFSDEARQKLVEITGKNILDIPIKGAQENVIASFEKDESSSIIHLIIRPFDVSIADVTVSFESALTNIHARDSSSTIYTTEEVEALITVWARQIATDRPRRGIIFRLNKAINGEL